VVAKEKLRVLVLSDAGAFHTERYMAEMARQGVEVMLLSLEEGRIEHLRLARRGPIRSLWYVMAATEVRKALRTFQPDILNPHFASGYGFTAALANSRKTVPVALHLWGSDILVVPGKSVFHARKTAHALNHADLVFADSHFLMKEAEELATLKKKLVIPWGIEERFLSLNNNHHQMARPLKIIVPRHQEKVYNNLFLVQALAPHINAGQIEMSFSSFGSLAGDFRFKVKPLVGDAIRFYDPMDRPDFLRFMAQHDLYLSSAITDSSPVSLIEAMALGLVPIAADVPGVREWLDDDSGYPYELYNGAELQKIIGNLITNPTNHEVMRRRNFERVKQEALFESNVGQMIEAMQGLVRRSGS
jgi:L-malate glycosyltransferase